MAVYTKVSDDEMEDFFSQYNIGEVVFYKGIAEGIENTNFLVQTSVDNFILTIYEKRVNPKELPFFINLMQHLATKNFPCPEPIKDKKGAILKEIASKPTIISSFLKGMSPKKITVEHCGELGSAMAKMHLALEDFTMIRPNSMSIESWHELYQKTKDDADKVAPNLAAEIADNLNEIEKLWPQDLPKGIIHADVFPDNVFFLGKKLSGIIDFYFACTDFLAYELAITLNAWCFEDDFSFNITKARKMFSEYNKIRKLSDAEIKALPILARGSALRFLLTRLYDFINTPKDALVNVKDPTEYLMKLRFHRAVMTPEAYGIY
ncbi:MAG: homoserine kinase [Alphaproteobacteria bacterium]